MHVHYGDHVSGVLADQVKQLFAFHQFPADPVNQKMLIDRVQVEEKNQAHQTANGLRHHIL